MLIPNDKEISKNAERRLEVIERHCELGAGYHIATHDMEIRGAGNILGKEQHGHTQLVGYELYMELLSEALEELRGNEHLDSGIDPEIDCFLNTVIPEVYLPQADQRLLYYGKFSRAKDFSTLDGVYAQLLDMCGPAPDDLKNYYQLMEIRILLKRMRVIKSAISKKSINLAFHPNNPLIPEKIMSWVQKNKKFRQVKPNFKLKIESSEKHENLLFARQAILDLAKSCVHSDTYQSLLRKQET